MVPARLTVWESGLPLLSLLAKLLAPVYRATIWWAPATSEAVVQLARPPASSATAPHRADPPTPSVKVTEPVAPTDEPLDWVTVARYVSDWPKTDGLLPAVSATAVAVPVLMVVEPRGPIVLGGQPPSENVTFVLESCSATV